MKRIKNLLTAKGFKIIHMILECDQNEMCRRIIERNTSKLINTDKAKQLNSELKLLSADFRIDTTYISADEVADRVIGFITGGITNETD